MIKDALLNMVPDTIYLKYYYRKSIGKKLNLKNPKSFNEKIQWLKIHDRNPEYINLVDKYEVKKYVSSIIGEEHVIPTLGVWDSFEEIDFDLLPSRFVLKCTHDSGGVVICYDKKTFDVNGSRDKLSQSLKKNYYWSGREWPYKGVNPRIIAEKYMEDTNSQGLKGSLIDYKIHCFNGAPRLILVCKNRFGKNEMTEDFYDVNWTHLDISREKHPNSEMQDKKPPEFDEMINMSRLLSKDIPFIRTDFYIINGKVYFGELTLYPASGFEKFIPDTYDEVLGNWLEL